MNKENRWVLLSKKNTLERNRDRLSKKVWIGAEKSKLKETSETDVNVSILALNLDRINAAVLAEIKNR